MKIRPVKAAFFHAVRRTDRQTDRRRFLQYIMTLNIIFVFYGFKTWTHLRTHEASSTFDNANGFVHNQCAQLSVRHSHTWWHHLPLACPMTPARPLFMQPQLDRSPRQMQIWHQRFGANGGRRTAVCKQRDVTRRESADPKETSCCHLLLSFTSVLSYSTTHLQLLVLPQPRPIALFMNNKMGTDSEGTAHGQVCSNHWLSRLQHVTMNNRMPKKCWIVDKRIKTTRTLPFGRPL
jgi:hypothetical protein